MTNMLRDSPMGRALEGDSNEIDSFSDLKDATWVFVVLLLLCIMISIFTILFIREYLLFFHDIWCCRKRRPIARNVERMDVEANRNLSSQPSPQRSNGDPSIMLSPTSSNGSEYEEMRGRRIREKRMRRRSWYEYSLSKFTHVIKEEDLIEEQIEPNDPSDCESQTGAAKSIVINRENGTTVKFDDTCCICLDQYQVGDKVVFSPMEDCKHAFCWECKLAWLEKGKKRCPVCRAWFVPGSAISDQINAEFGEDIPRHTTVTEVSLEVDREEETQEIYV